jgi:adenylylsulfate kinase-like enzyme
MTEELKTKAFKPVSQAFMDDNKLQDIPTTAVERIETNTLALFKEQLEAYINMLQGEQTRNELEHLISGFFTVHVLNRFHDLGKSLVNTADFGKNQFVLKDCYLVTYIFATPIKNLAILHRDVLLELTKNAVYEHDTKFPQEKLMAHLRESQKVLLQATLATRDTILTKEKELSLRKKSEQLVKRAMDNMASPWPSYSLQFTDIVEQIESIIIAHTSVLNNHDLFADLKKVLKGIDVQFQLLLAHYNEIVKVVSDKIAAQDQAVGDYGIDQALERASQMGNVQRSVQLNEDIRAITAQLQLEELPVSSVGGVLQIRELQLSRTVQKWLDYEIYPLLADLYAIEENLKLKIHLRLTGLKNLLNLNKQNPVFELSRIFNIVDEELVAASELSEQIKNSIAAKLDKELHVRAFYSNENFLNVPIQTTIGKSRKDFITNIITGFKKAQKLIESWYKENTYINSRTALQETTMCIADRMRFTELDHYDSLFMNRNFIGDLFYIVRKEEEAVFKRAVQEWNASFAKAVLITGRTSSGKSTFMQQTVKRAVKSEVIYLQPHSTITIDGRKFSTTASLVHALEHIKKSSQIQRSRPMLCLDNLESWQDFENNILDNIRALLRFIEEESQDVFVVVTCSSMFRHHMNHRFSFDDHFASILDMSRSGAKEIVKAVSIRHETSHKVLINASGGKVTKAKMQKEITALATQLNNNIGAVLQSWAFHTELVGEEEVRLINAEHEFISFFNEAELSILKQVVIYKQTSERSLKRITAREYDSKYKAPLKRLINIKILQRNLEGHLLVNPVIAHEVEHLFIKKLKL